MPQSAAFSSPWKTLADMIGQKAEDMTVLPLKLQALPSSPQGRSAVRDLAEHCSRLLPALARCFQVASMKGDRERAFLVSWQRFTAFREKALRLVDVLLTKGFSPVGNLSEWFGSVRDPFLEFLRTADMYEDAHKRGICATTVITPQEPLLENQGASPKWKGMKALQAAAPDFHNEMAKHVFSAMQEILATALSQSKTCYKFAKDDGDWKEVLIKRPSTAALRAFLEKKDVGNLSMVATIIIASIVVIIAMTHNIICVRTVVIIDKGGFDAWLLSSLST